MNIIVAQGLCKTLLFQAPESPTVNHSQEVVSLNPDDAAAILLLYMSVMLKLPP